MTQYIWPTWADIVARSLGREYENWGRSGMGNVGIFNRIVESNQRNGFKPGDVILVMWSTMLREDRHINHRWLTPGNIYNQKDYNKNFMKKYWCDVGATLMSCNAIVAA